MDYKMLVFDMDMTLISFKIEEEFLPMFHKAYRKTLKDVTGTDYSHLTGEKLYTAVSSPNGESKRILKSWGVKDPEKFWKLLAKEDLKARLALMDKITAYPDAIEMFRKVPKGTRKVLLTNSPPEITSMQLKRTGLEDKFDRVYAFCYNEPKSKPSPWAIQKEMKAHGFQPHEVAMIGDNYCDTNTGHNAGVVTAQLYRINHHHSQESNPHVKGKDLVEIWNGLLELSKERFDEMQMRQRRRVLPEV